MSVSSGADNICQMPDLARETGWRSWLTVPQDRFNGSWTTFLLILIAWAVCSFIRYRWFAWAEGFDAFRHEGLIQPTTHDAFTHGAVLQQHLEGLHQENPNLYPILNKQGALHAFSWVFLKLFPVPISTLMVWAPIFLGSLMTVPLVLIGRLYGSALWGFTAAILGGVAWNYYERTMAGYFDTDLFSFWVALVVAYLLMLAHESRSIHHAGVAALVVFIYPFFYAKGLVIGAGIAGCFIGLQLICIVLKKDVLVRFALLTVVGAGIAASPWSNGTRIHDMPWLWFIGLFAIIIIWALLASRIRQWRQATATGQVSDQVISTRATAQFIAILAGICLVSVLFSMPWGKFVGQLETYSNMIVAGNEVVTQIDPVELKRSQVLDEINFRKTHKNTILESRGEPFADLCVRIIGSVTGAILAFIGYVLLCIRYPAFLICFPMFAIGLFAFDGGLRFTTWGGLVAASSLVYMLFIIPQAFLRCLPGLTIRSRRVGAVAAGMLLASPFIAVNITHAISFKVPPVFRANAIKAMESIKDNSEPGAYVLSWWDYGSGLWYYANRNVLMTPISASDDCWTIATISMSDSQEVAAGLAGMAADSAARGLLPASHDMLGVEGDTPLTPRELTSRLDRGQQPLPEHTNDVFLYFPMDMLKLLSVIEAYADPDYALPTVPEAGVYHFMPPGTARQLPGTNQIMLPSRVIIDLENLTASVHDKRTNKRIPVAFNSIAYVYEDEQNGFTGVREGPKINPEVPHLRLVALGGTPSQYRLLGPDDSIPENFHLLNLLILEESGNMIVMDDEFLNSNIIQMVVMQKFDRDLFKLIYKSGFARVFQLKNPDEMDGLDPVGGSAAESATSSS